MIEEIIKALKDGSFREKFKNNIRTHDVDFESYVIGEYNVIIDLSNKIAWITNGNKIVKTVKEVKV